MTGNIKGARFFVSCLKAGMTITTAVETAYFRAEGTLKDCLEYVRRKAKTGVAAATAFADFAKITQDVNMKRFCKAVFEYAEYGIPIKAEAYLT